MEQSAVQLESLQEADPQQLAKFLEVEHPQTIALILAHLNARQASALLLRLPEEVRAETVKRLAQLRQFSPEVAQKVALSLNKHLESLGEQSRRAYAGFKGAAFPAMEAARKLTIAGKPLGSAMATASPRRMPAEASAFAISSTCRRSES